MAEIDQLAIRAALLNGEITWQQAIEALTASPKPWHTRAWKEKRDTLIRDECQQCSSRQPPKVLQHLQQP